MEPEVIDRAASAVTEHAAGVGVVHHHDGALFLRDVRQFGQYAEVTVHAEHAVRDEERPLALGPLRENGAGARRIAVREYLDARAAQPGAVNDAGVIELVRHDEIVTAE